MQASVLGDPPLVDNLIRLHIVRADLKLESDKSSIDTSDHIGSTFSGSPGSVYVYVINTEPFEMLDAFCL